MLFKIFLEFDLMLLYFVLVNIIDMNAWKSGTNKICPAILIIFNV